ncbi:MAG: adenylate/guanylate cyclase domain-containing protein, partial [Proteobacteria bacterium]|nr:adenylate/guanylate cyclase domain-containing protein [Pseudomonadota bacterium]
LDVALPVASVLLVGVLAFAIVYPMRFETENRKNKRLRRIFERYGSEAVVQWILDAPGGLGLGGARRQMTILFCDIRDFTSLSEQLAPEEVVELLNEYFSRVCRPILNHHGLVDKFIGDAVMAVFGAPLPREDHARQAVMAAWEMQRELMGFRRWLDHRFPERGYGESFKVGIGLHTGHAVAGNIGFDKRTDFTVIGDAVNTASRIEGLTKEMGCGLLISVQTLKEAGEGIVRTGRTTELKVKGRVKPVRVFEVLSIVELK